MDWIRVTVYTTTEGSDYVGELMGEVSPGGVIVEDAADLEQFQRTKEDWDYIDEQLAAQYGSEVAVRGFLPQDENAQATVAKLRTQIEAAQRQNPDFSWGSLKVECETVKDENWGEKWKEFYKPFKPGNRIVIKPSWEAYEPQKGDLVLELDPGAAFGTGCHETTQLCIAFLEEYLHEGDRVLDVGCGTGILAMCAYLLGAGSVKAIDIDAEAVRVAKDNIRRTGFPISVLQGNLLEEDFGVVDLIVANIIADAVMKLATGARAHLKTGGVYITSGVIRERADEVRARIGAEGFSLLKEETRGEWTAFVWKKI